MSNAAQLRIQTLVETRGGNPNDDPHIRYCRFTTLTTLEDVIRLLDGAEIGCEIWQTVNDFLQPNFGFLLQAFDQLTDANKEENEDRVHQAYKEGPLNLQIQEFVVGLLSGAAESYLKGRPRDKDRYEAFDKAWGKLPRLLSLDFFTQFLVKMEDPHWDNWDADLLTFDRIAKLIDRDHTAFKLVYKLALFRGELLENSKLAQRAEIDLFGRACQSAYKNGEPCPLSVFDPETRDIYLGKRWLNPVFVNQAMHFWGRAAVAYLHHKYFCVSAFQDIFYNELDCVTEDRDLDEFARLMGEGRLTYAEVRQKIHSLEMLGNFHAKCSDKQRGMISHVDFAMYRYMLGHKDPTDSDFKSIQRRVMNEPTVQHLYDASEERDEQEHAVSNPMTLADLSEMCAKEGLDSAEKKLKASTGNLPPFEHLTSVQKDFICNSIDDMWKKATSCSPMSVGVVQLWYAIQKNNASLVLIGKRCCENPSSWHAIFNENWDKIVQILDLEPFYDLLVHWKIIHGEKMRMHSDLSYVKRRKRRECRECRENHCKRRKTE